MRYSFVKVMSVLLMIVFSVTSCATYAPSTQMVSYGGNPNTQPIRLSEESLLTCFTNNAWDSRKKTQDGIVAIKVTSVGDATGKVAYGENGLGALLPVENVTTAIAAVQLAKGGRGSVSPIDWVDGSSAFVLVQKDEIQLGLRTVAQNQIGTLPADYYLLGNTVSVDSVMVVVNQLIAYGVGGGPREERWSFDMNLRLVDAFGHGVATSSLYNQYVQKELKFLISSVVGGGIGKTTLSSDNESVVRGKFQSLMRPMIYVGVAELLSQLPGAPVACANNVQRFLNTPKSPSQPVRTAANDNSPAELLRRKTTVAAA